MKLARDMDADHRNSMADVETDNIAVRHERGERESRSLAPRSRHGGALPD